MAVLVALTLTLTVAVAVVGCAKTDEVAAGRSTERRVAYVTSKVMPTGRTVRAAVADGSITATEVPGDLVTDEPLEDTTSVECLVAVRAIPAGTILRRSMFGPAESIGLDDGLTDGTTVDGEC